VTMTTETDRGRRSGHSDEQDWADISDDDEETAATIKVDSLDLKNLSINENSNPTKPGGYSFRSIKLTLRCIC
jgi:hypothetical protein